MAKWTACPTQFALGIKVNKNFVCQQYLQFSFTTCNYCMLHYSLAVYMCSCQWCKLSLWGIVSHFVYLWNTKLCIIDKLLGHWYLKDKKGYKNPLVSFHLEILLSKLKVKRSVIYLSLINNLPKMKIVLTRWFAFAGRFSHNLHWQGGKH